MGILHDPTEDAERPLDREAEDQDLEDPTEDDPEDDDEVIDPDAEPQSGMEA